MTSPYANIQPTPKTDGATYCSAKRLGAAEGDLGNLDVPYNVYPVCVPYGQQLVAEVVFTITPGFSSNSSYVVLQGDMGDDNWIDLAWCLWSGTSGNALFFLATGAPVGNSVQQTRAFGTAPGSSGSVQLPIPGRIRFTGKATLGGGGGGSPSPSPGVSTGVFVSIRYKFLGLR